MYRLTYFIAGITNCIKALSGLAALLPKYATFAYNAYQTSYTPFTPLHLQGSMSAVRMYSDLKGQHLAKPSHILTAIMTCLAIENSLPGRRPTRNVSAFKKTAEIRITETLLFKVSFFHVVFTYTLKLDFAYSTLFTIAPRIVGVGHVISG
jgi:hypothetical protein